MATLKTNTLTGTTTAGSIAVTGEGNSTTTNLQQGLAKSFIRCPQNGASISSSFNITSLTDVSAGRTTVIIANNMANANYSVAECTDENINQSWCDDIATGQYDHDTYTGSGYLDIGKMSQTFGDLA
jgi:hypothetical protein